MIEEIQGETLERGRTLFTVGVLDEDLVSDVYAVWRDGGD
jgi:hypothetical protein